MLKKTLLLSIFLLSFLRASELELGFGMGAMHYPDYLGSNSTNRLVIPYPYISYRSKKLEIDREGLKQELFAIDGLSVRLSMSGSLPVKSSGAREGMSDLDPAGEIGPALVYNLYEYGEFNLKLDIPIRAVLSTDGKGVDYRGYISELKVKMEYEADGYLYQLHTGGVWGDSRYHEYIYGVKQEFVTANRDYYEAKAGYSGYKTSLGISKKLEQLWIGSFIRYYSLAGSSFGNSPLKRKNSAIYGGIFIAYLFDKKFSKKVKQWIE